MIKIAAFTLMALPALASAETITFSADEELLIVRGRQTGDDARYELLGPREGRIQCVALDGDNNPLAVESSWAQMGFVRFDEINVNTISRVVCRYN